MVGSGTPRAAAARRSRARRVGVPAGAGPGPAPVPVPGPVPGPVILFAVYAFMDAGIEGVRAFSSGKAGPVIGHLLLALVDLAAGVVALVWPSPTALVLTVVVGIWAIFGGFLEIFAGFGSGETAG